MKNIKHNLAQNVIDDFGEEWSLYNYLTINSEAELDSQFKAYLRPLDLSIFDKTTAVAADFGAGSGRWCVRISKYFSKVIALEPSDKAVKVLKLKTNEISNIQILHETIEACSIPEESLDLAFSLGVLHHISDTKFALNAISEKIKPGGFFLCYLYYKLENKPIVYRLLFKISNFARFVISKFPFPAKKLTCLTLALLVYLPLAKTTQILNRLGINTENLPLHQYSEMTFEMMANDSLDRFGTKLELRFSKEEIIDLLRDANFDLNTLVFSEEEPFWTFAVQKNNFNY